MDKLNNEHVAVFGIGGVGGYVVEALARSGVGTFTLVDNDTISLTNINRQIIATMDTVGKYKVNVMKERILSINPNAIVNIHKSFVLKENIDEFNFSSYTYIVDAVDTVSTKIELVLKANQYQIPIISSMGAGNKVNPTLFEVSDIYKTSVCPLAKVMRRELKKRNIKKLKVVYSKEKPRQIIENEDILLELKQTKKRSIPASNAFVPSVVGLIIASEVINDIVK
jgi:tRNA A37 threonylcarbamoyladenosine dehydratase